MMSSKDYCKSIYNRFKYNPPIESPDIPLTKCKDSPKNVIETDYQLDNDYYQIFRDFLKNMSEVKFIRKNYDEMFDIYLDKMVFLVQILQRPIQK